jgi:hypothetical protein
MILNITHQAARLLATQDAQRAMKTCEYNGISFCRSEAFDDFRYEGLGDVIILNPKATLEDDVVKTYDEAYREVWHLA